MFLYAVPIRLIKTETKDYPYGIKQDTNLKIKPMANWQLGTKAFLYFPQAMAVLQ